MPPAWNCSGLKDDDYKLCQNRWWKYSVTKELYQTRRQMAKMKGLLWGAYHLARPGNPRAQADHFIEFAEPAKDELIALDIEDNSDEWMSLSDAEIFADQIKIRTGRYPVLYTNGSTAKFIADNAADYPLLSRLPLWYARYRDDITGKFPTDNWSSYALWQFSSMHNCNERSCPYRVKGAKTDIDVNVSTYDVAGLQKAWPFDELIEKPGSGNADNLIASVSETTKSEVAAAASLGKKAPAEPAPGGTLVAAYGPGEHHATIDPLQMLTAIAKGDKPAALAEATTSEKVAGAAETQPAAASPAHQTAPASPLVKSFSQAVSLAADTLDRLIAPPAEAAVRLPEQSLRRKRGVAALQRHEGHRRSGCGTPGRRPADAGPGAVAARRRPLRSRRPRPPRGCRSPRTDRSGRPADLRRLRSNPLRRAARPLPALTADVQRRRNGGRISASFDDPSPV
ncbi:GH25 family lysozyme [Jiella pelagia]|uniref:GH25 family lysozyme n=1 Tax=Jiella pelagia TaxID=2986949 RepID=A0ABY7CAC9_9HYPH|nr:GH25 family lysozyme [Jiella pelagia]WAP70745.1 GH25 family lysozyme [Jiella pelagia]